MKQPLEKEIQFAICEYLEYRKGLLFWRQNTGGLYDPTKDIIRKMPRFAMKGVPDICVIKDGKYIGLEVKRPGSKQSEGQVEFQKKCEEAGGKYFVVSSIDDVQKIGL